MAKFIDSLAKRQKTGTLKQSTQDILTDATNKIGVEGVKSKLAGVNPVESPVSQQLKEKNFALQDNVLSKPTGTPTGTPPVSQPSPEPVLFGDTPKSGITPKSQIETTPTVSNGVNNIPDSVQSAVDNIDSVTNKLGTTPTNDFITQAGELNESEKQVYDMLSDAEKKQFEAIGENARKAGQDYVKAQAEYLANAQQTKKRLGEDFKAGQEMRAISGEISDITSKATIENQRKGVMNLKQNIAYLGNMGMPGVSATRIGALERQVSDAEKTLANVEKIEMLQKDAKELGEESIVRQYGRQLEDLQQDLDNKIDKVIQDSLGELSRTDILAKLEDEADVEELRIKLLNSLDEQIAGVTDANIQQRQFLIDRYDQYAERQLTYIQNKNKINEEMSAVQGFYVDGNGNPIISADTGARIQIPEEAPLEPVYDEKKGQLITFSLDEAGNIVGNVTKIMPDATYSEQIVSGIAQAVQKGTLSLEQVAQIYPGLENNPAITQAVGSTMGDRFINVGGNLFDVEKEQFISPSGTAGEMTGFGSTGTYTGEFGDLTNVLRRPQGSRNVGQDTNNPGNIMAESPQGIEYAKSLGAIGFYKSPNGRTYAVFPDMQTGLEATKKDIASKLSGGSRWVTPATTLGQLASGWTSGPNAPLNENAIKNFERLTGFGRNTLISQIPQDKIIDAIVKNEGVDINKGADLSYLSQKRQIGEIESPFSPGQFAILSSFNGKDIKKLSEDLGVTEVQARTMFDNYKKDYTLGYEDSIKLKNILKQISGKTVTNEERASYVKDFVDMRKAGLNDEQIKDRVAEYYLYDNNNGNIQMQNTLNGLRKFAFGVDEALPANVASQINNGNVKGAISSIENKRFETAKLENPTFEVENMTNIYQRTMDSIFEYEKNFGPVAGWTTKKWNKYMGENPEFTEMLSNLATFVADYRNKISGTAVTTSESAFLDDVIPTIQQSPNTVASKLSALMKKVSGEYNAKRKQVGLPELTKEEILDFNKKLNKYTGGEIQTIQPITRGRITGTTGGRIK